MDRAISIIAPSAQLLWNRPQNTQNIWKLVFFRILKSLKGKNGPVKDYFVWKSVCKLDFMSGIRYEVLSNIQQTYNFPTFEYRTEPIFVSLQYSGTQIPKMFTGLWKT